MHRPPVLFLDEPTTGLDPQGRNELWGVIEELVRDGTTVLLTTQYLEEADFLADYIVVIDHGSVIAEGTATAAQERLGATVIEITLARRRRAPHAAAEVLAPIGGASRSTGKLVRVSVAGGAGPSRCSTRSASSTASSSTPPRMVLREPTLDDVFLELTGHAAERRRRRRRSMTTVDATARPRHDAPTPPPLAQTGVHAVGDAITMAWRNLLNIRRNPQLLVFATIQPVIFVLMFRYVFGGAIQGSLRRGRPT